MEASPTAQRDALLSDILLAHKMVTAGFVPSRDRKPEKARDLWCTFCTSINADPEHPKMADPVPILHAFGVIWSNGCLTPSTKPNCYISVEDAIQIVIQTFPTLGDKEPHLYCTGKQYFCRCRMYSDWKNEEDPPARVKPVPLTILLQV